MIYIYNECSVGLFPVLRMIYYVCVGYCHIRVKAVVEQQESLLTSKTLLHPPLLASFSVGFF